MTFQCSMAWQMYERYYCTASGGRERGLGISLGYPMAQARKQVQSLGRRRRRGGRQQARQSWLLPKFEEEVRLHAFNGRQRTSRRDVRAYKAVMCDWDLDRGGLWGGQPKKPASPLLVLQVASIQRHWLSSKAPTQHPATHQKERKIRKPTSKRIHSKMCEMCSSRACTVE